MLIKEDADYSAQVCSLTRRRPRRALLLAVKELLAGAIVRAVDTTIFKHSREPIYIVLDLFYWPFLLSQLACLREIVTADDLEVLLHACILLFEQLGQLLLRLQRALYVIYLFVLVLYVKPHALLGLVELQEIGEVLVGDLASFV